MDKIKKIASILLILTIFFSSFTLNTISVNASSAISITHNASTTQTITYSVDSGTTTYYWGTNSDYTKNSSTNPSYSTTSVKKTITEPGSYYMTSYKETRNASGNLVGSVTSTYDTVTFYKVSLDANGGVIVGANYVLASDYGGEYTNLPTPSPTRAGYRFIGWSTSSNATSGVTSVCPHSNLTYYAVWEKVSNTTGKTVVLDTSQLDVGNATWLAWTWSDGTDGYWVRGYSTGTSKITFESLEKNVVFAALSGDGTAPYWGDCVAQTEDLTVDGSTFTVTGKYVYVSGIWSGSVVQTTEPTTNTNSTLPTVSPTTSETTTESPNKEVVWDGKTGACKWRLNDKTGVLTISGKGAMKNYKNSWDMPWAGSYIEKIVVEEGVTSIGDNCFSQDVGPDKIKNVVLPSTLKRIGKYAFSNCVQLKTILIPKSVTEIGEGAFYNSRIKSITLPQNIKTISSRMLCGTNISSIKIPNKVSKIGWEAFSYTDIKSVTIPSNVKTISGCAFEYCNKLKTVKLSNGVQKIADSAFHGSNKISKINIPASAKITKDLKWAFFDTSAKVTVSPKNKYYSAKGGVLFNNKRTILYQYPTWKKSKKYTIPKTVKEIYGDAFSGNEKLTKVTMGNKVGKIGNYAFAYCYKLKTIKLSRNISKLGYGVFQYCKSLTRISWPKKVTNLPRYTFSGCSKFKKIAFSKKSKLKKIGAEAFSDCKSLVGILDFPDSVTSIGKWAFYGCKKMKGVVIFTNVKKIGEQSFGFYNSIGTAKSNGLFTKKIKNFAIYGKSGTVAQKYANKNGIKFIAI